ncbi:hypothetical protein [Lysinibacter cavernae]|uniref:hypothetical protein n=1 Tax=Lysinibacter cavernae TaxID=1640652 RepID=UPI00360B8CDA
MNTPVEICTAQTDHVIEEGDLIRVLASNGIWGEWDFVALKDGALAYRDVMILDWQAMGFQFERSLLVETLESVAAQLRRTVETYRYTPHLWALSSDGDLRRLNPGDAPRTFTTAAPPALSLTAMLLEDISEDMRSGFARLAEIQSSIKEVNNLIRAGYVE